MALDAGTVHATIRADAGPAIAEIKRAERAVIGLRRQLAALPLARLRVGSFGDVEPPRGRRGA